MAKLCMRVLAMWSAAHLAVALQTNGKKFDPLGDAIRRVLHIHTNSDEPSHGKVTMQPDEPRALDAATKEHLADVEREVNEPAHLAVALQTNGKKFDPLGDAIRRVLHIHTNSDEPSHGKVTMQPDEPRALDAATKQHLADVEREVNELDDALQELKRKNPTSEKVFEVVTAGSRLSAVTSLVTKLLVVATDNQWKAQKRVLAFTLGEIQDKMREAVALTPETIRRRLATELDLPAALEEVSCDECEPAVDAPTAEALNRLFDEADRLAHVMAAQDTPASRKVGELEAVFGTISEFSKRVSMVLALGEKLLHQEVQKQRETIYLLSEEIKTKKSEIVALTP